MYILFYISNNIVFAFTGVDNFSLIILSVCSLLFAVAILGIAYIISTLRKPNLLRRTEGFETYEFGATTIGNSSLLAVHKHFYILGVLFIVFDVELMLLYPWVYSYNETAFNEKVILITMLIYLMWAFYYEVVSGALNWYSAPSHALSQRFGILFTISLIIVPTVISFLIYNYIYCSFAIAKHLKKFRYWINPNKENRKKLQNIIILYAKFLVNIFNSRKGIFLLYLK